MPHQPFVIRWLAAAPTVEEKPDYHYRLDPTGLVIMRRSGIVIGQIFPDGTAVGWPGPKKLAGVEALPDLDAVAARFQAHYEAAT